MRSKTEALPKFSEQDKLRFWSKIAKASDDSCWNWTEGKTQHGYGQFYIGGKTVKAHRCAYELHNGPVAGEFTYILHSCDNPACCNPSHLRQGTAKDNVADKITRGRGDWAKGEKHGSFTKPWRVAKGEKANSKLTRLQVLEIKARAAAGEVKRRLAEEFNVTPSNISRITKGVNWAWLNKEPATAQ